MAYFPNEMPAPEPVMDDAGFWDGCYDRQLRFQGCAGCGQLRHPPTPICANCHSTQVKWFDAPAKASVYSFTVVHHASHPAVVPKLPYVVAVVEFTGLTGIRFVTNITDVAPSDVHIGMDVQLWWDELDGAGGDSTPMFIPRFRPASADPR